MTPEQLKEIKKRLGKLTHLPWRTNGGCKVWQDTDRINPARIARCNGYKISNFVANAPADIAALLGAVLRSKKFRGNIISAIDPRNTDQENDPGSDAWVIGWVVEMRQQKDRLQSDIAALLQAVEELRGALDNAMADLRVESHSVDCKGEDACTCWVDEARRVLAKYRHDK